MTKYILFMLCLFVFLPKSMASSTCFHSRYEAVDLASPVNMIFLDKMKALGVSTIIRYYDWDKATLPHKNLTKDELAQIASRGLAVAVVFQHNAKDPSSYTIHKHNYDDRGTVDAIVALRRAKALGQPAGSTIYFGTDGMDDNISKIGPGWKRIAAKLLINYFHEVDDAVGKEGYDTGVYGSGFVCGLLLSKGLAKFCWLANATSWPDTKSYSRSGGWVVKQALPVKCGGLEIDPDAFNPTAAAQIGQWKP